MVNKAKTMIFSIHVSLLIKLRFSLQNKRHITEPWRFYILQGNSRMELGRCLNRKIRFQERVNKKFPIHSGAAKDAILAAYTFFIVLPFRMKVSVSIYIASY